MTRWIRTALIGAAVTLGLLVPVASALAADSSPAADPDSGTLTWSIHN